MVVSDYENPMRNRSAEKQRMRVSSKLRKWLLVLGIVIVILFKGTQIWQSEQDRKTVAAMTARMQTV